MRNVRRTKRRSKAGLMWSARDVAALTELYPAYSNRDLATRLGRSEWAISGKARELGLKKDHGLICRKRRSGGRSWTREETDLLRTLYPTMPDEEIAERIGRSRDAVHMKARKLRLRKMRFWSEREDRFLRDTYRVYRLDDVARRLGRTLLAIKTRVLTLKLPPKVPNWTSDEVQFLRKSYGDMGLETIATALGRTEAAVARKASLNGLVARRFRSGHGTQRSRERHHRGVASESVDKRSDRVRAGCLDSSGHEATKPRLYQHTPPIGDLVVD